MKIHSIDIYRTAILFLILSLPAQSQVQIEPAFPNLSFGRPVDLQQPPDSSNRLFVVEQRGVISVFQNFPSASQKSVFLDIQNQVNSSGNEQGLLGLAFHPNYANNGYFFVDYTASGTNRTVISRFRISQTNPDSADQNSEVVIMEIPQPYTNHNGGQVSFGPDDYLYIALGDGGSGGDPQGNGQNLQTLLGSILRIDVDSSAAGLNYAIPPDNPFAGNALGYREEIYAYGLRNPWRFSWDLANQRLWCGDVGQSAWEEIDIIKKGRNYGWNIMEGFHCYSSPSCDTTGLTLPVWEYAHNSSGGVAITGGFVYRGSTVQELFGKYVYADYSSGHIWALEYDGVNPPTNTVLMTNAPSISSFGVDLQNELYFCSFDGNIYRFGSTATGTGTSTTPPSSFTLISNYPNPFNSGTTIVLELTESQRVEIFIFDVRGNRIVKLKDTLFSPGAHTIRWNGRDENNREVSSGIYIYRVQANDEAVSRKMLLVR